jgi:eukaryotic-like serine/threonine-protein kinase
MSNQCPKCNAGNPETSRFCADCGTELFSTGAEKISRTKTLETALEELKTGSTFAGRYQIIEELGHGGMGRVYRAVDQKLNEEVALKLIRPEIALDKKTLERFQNELKLARKISHRNIGRMYELLEDKGYHFITMEYVPGQDLRGLVRQTGILTTAKAVSIAKQVCEGLAEAHRLGIIHRDLKPSNIIIDKEGNARIMDFGIARSLKGKGITGEGVIIGTPEYMSPEQVEGKETDQRSDLYSLGIILYEMVTGRVPFEGDTPFTVGVKHKSETPKNPRELNPQIPEDLSRLILRCLEKEKDRRYQSAEDVRADLEKIEPGLPTTTFTLPKRKASISKEITVKFELKKALVPVLGIAALVAVALILWHFLPKRPAAPPPSGKPSLAILYFENISGDKTLDAWKTGLTELLITKLSQSKFIKVLDANTIYGLLRRLNLAEAGKYTNEDLVKVANEGGANYTLSGSLMKAGDKIILNLTLQKPQTSEVISPLNIECQSEAEIISKIDDVANRIKSDLNLSSEQIAGDIDKEAGKITTSSPEAFKYYSEARIYHLSLDYRNAIPLYEKAVAIDPEFAMAYRGLASAFSNLGYFSKRLEYARKAFELRDRVSEREAHIITAQYYYVLSEKTYDKAIEALTKLLEIYPDDFIGNNYIGMIYGALEEWDKAQTQNEKIAQIRKDLLTYWNLSNIYNIKGLYDKSLRLFENYQKNISDNARVHVYLGQIYLYQGKYEPALQEADKAFLLSPNFIFAFYLKGDAYFLSGKFPEAEKEYLKALEQGNKSYYLGARMRLAMPYVTQGKYGKAKEQVGLAVALADEVGENSLKANALLYSGYIDLRAGNKESALDALKRALALLVELDDLARQRFVLAMEGLVYLEMGSVTQAERVAAELKELIEKGLNKKAWRYYFLLEGLVELDKKDFSKAIGNFNQAISLVSFQSGIPDEQAIFFGPLAEAYYKAGDLKKAWEEYERITSLTVGRAIYGDIFAKSFYMLGKIAQQQGDKVKARKNYETFLDLWKDADPGQPEVEDARRQLDKL